MNCRKAGLRAGWEPGGCREELLGDKGGGAGGGQTQQRGHIREGIEKYQKAGNKEERGPCGPHLPINKVHDDDALEHPKCFVSIGTMNTIVSGQVVLG